MAPRVGNQKFEPGTDLVELVQQLCDQDEQSMQVSCVFICRGTDRFQAPLTAPKSQDAPLRLTLSVHRTTGKIHHLGYQHWHLFTRAQRIAKSIPGKLTLTIFGTSRKEIENQVIEKAPMPAPDSEPPGTAVRALPMAKLNPEICEGWAPPPIPLHGPNFRKLSSHEKSQLALLHRNLGHPDPNILAAHLKDQKAPEHIVEGALDFVCDTCVETRKPLHQRPAKLQDPKEFNDLVGIDGIFWKGQKQCQYYAIHILDEASGFHMAKRLDGQNMDHVIPAISDMWTAWAGAPKGIYLDPAGEFRSDVWLHHLQSTNTHVHMTTEAWQRGRVERHGAILKDMLTKIDHEVPICTISDFELCLRLCCQAKNQLSKKGGYSPEQIVLGKSTPLPGSLAFDESTAAHSLALGEDLESQKFKENLEKRTLARTAFIQAENSEAIRRALLRRSCPTRGPFEPGQMVMYWIKRPRPNRSESGRWCGPARDG